MLGRLSNNAALSTVCLMAVLGVSSKRKLGSLGNELIQVFRLSKKMPERLRVCSPLSLLKPVKS